MSKIDELTAKEMSIAERTAGQSITSLDNPDAPKVGLLTALAWVVLKRETPTLTYAEVEELSFSKITEALGLDDEDDEDSFPVEGTG